ncbi:MAG: crotonase/enoyl-CoA hydratase family protein [Bacteroidota bacterium]
MERVKIEINNHIAVVSFNRAEKMNALDPEQFRAIIEAGKQVGENAAVRVVVLRGEGRAFCAGLDVMAFQADSEVTGNSLIPRTHGITNTWQQAVWVWRALPVPVIAAVHGVAFGGGLQIMLGADIKYITADTRLSIMEMKWGLIPDMAGTQLMRHSVRDDIIRELTYTNRVFSGAEAVQYGFATHLSENPFEDAMTLATEIASKSPSAIVKAKKLLNAAPYLNREEGLMMESVEQEAIMSQKNQLEAVFSSLQKRPGNFEDYRD